MNYTYKACKGLIETGNYISVEDMQQKLETFLQGERLSQAQYDELTALLEG